MVGIRCCVKCKLRKPKKDFFRVVADENNVAILDKNQHINKRAIYICKEKECIEQYINAVKKNKFNVKIDINKDSLLELLESLVVGMGE